jgi:cGMP-dependent protein kinase
VEIIIDGKAIRVMKEGDSFGEMALLYNAPRSASIKALSNESFYIPNS